MIDESLTEMQKQVLRRQMVEVASSLLGIHYDTEPGPPVVWTGRGKWIDLSRPPKSLDCSGETAGICHKVGLKFPDGSQAQFNATISVKEPQPGDFAFVGHGKDIHKIYHTGMVYDAETIIEARELDLSRNFDTGKVILRPRSAWENWNNFVGYRSHLRLA